MPHPHQWAEPWRINPSAGGGVAFTWTYTTFQRSECHLTEYGGRRLAVTVCSPCIDVLIIRRWVEKWNQTTGIRAELCTATRNKECRGCVCLCVRIFPQVRALAPINTLGITPLSMSPPPTTTRPRRSLLAIKSRKQSPLPDVWAGLTTGAYLRDSGGGGREKREG